MCYFAQCKYKLFQSILSTYTTFSNPGKRNKQTNKHKTKLENQKRKQKPDQFNARNVGFTTIYLANLGYLLNR